MTVRTLHHYDEIGLLAPSARSDAGYRLYSHADLLRLQEILVWRQLGFALDAHENGTTL
jgi:DNA-binding transcriptional MerR regulator